MYHLNVYLYPPTSASPSQDFLPAVCLSSPLSAIHRHIQAHLSAPCQFLLCLICSVPDLDCKSVCILQGSVKVFKGRK